MNADGEFTTETCLRQAGTEDAEKTGKRRGCDKGRAWISRDGASERLGAAPRTRRGGPPAPPLEPRTGVPPPHRSFLAPTCYSIIRDSLGF